MNTHIHTHTHTRTLVHTHGAKDTQYEREHSPSPNTDLHHDLVLGHLKQFLLPELRLSLRKMCSLAGWW